MTREGGKEGRKEASKSAEVTGREREKEKKKHAEAFTYQSMTQRRQAHARISRSEGNTPR